MSSIDTSALRILVERWRRQAAAFDAAHRNHPERHAITSTLSRCALELAGLVATTEAAPLANAVEVELRDVETPPTPIVSRGCRTPGCPNPPPAGSRLSICVECADVAERRRRRTAAAAYHAPECDCPKCTEARR